MFMIKGLTVGMVLFIAVWLLLRKKPDIWKRWVKYVDNAPERNIYLFLFFIIVVSAIPAIYIREFPNSADEVYTMANSAFFAGYDVSPFMHLKKFYNFGYTMFLAPIYMLFEDPIAIYDAFLICNTIVHAVIVMLTYYTARKYFKCKKCTGVAFALVCSANALLLYFRCFMYNEIPLALVNWLVLLLLVELTKSKSKERIILSLLLGVLLAYAYIIHSRCLIIYIAVFLVFVIYLAIYRKLLVEPVSFVLGFVPCYLGEQKLYDYIKANVYLKDADAVMLNSVEKVAGGTDKFEVLTSGDGIIGLVGHLFSLAGTVSIEMAGLLTVATVAVLYYFVKNIRKILKGGEDKAIFVSHIFSFMAFWGMIAAIAVVGADNMENRFLYYSRYFVPFMGPFFLSALYIMKNNKELKIKWIAIWSLLITVGVAVTYCFYTYPLLKDSSLNEITSTVFFIPFTYYKGQDSFTKSIVAIMLVLLIGFTFILLYLYKKRQMIALCMVIMVYSVVLMAGIHVMKFEKSHMRRYELIDEIYTICNETDLLDGKRIMCTPDKRFKNMMFFALYDWDVVYDKEEYEFNEGTVVVGPDYERVVSKSPKYIYQLDKNEWIGFWDDDLKDSFSERYSQYVPVE